MKNNSTSIKLFLSAVIFYVSTGYACALSYNLAAHIGFEPMQTSDYVGIDFLVLALSFTFAAIKLIKLN